MAENAVNSTDKKKRENSSLNPFMQILCSIGGWFRTAWKYFWKMLRRYRFLVLITLIIVVLVTGYIGFSIAIESQGPDNLLYYTLQLFVLQSGADVPINYPLEIARFIAAFLAFYTLFFVIWLLIEHLQLFKLKLFRGHVVICGLGYLGPAIARRYIEHKDVVIIEKDPDNPEIQLWRDEGAIVLVGDAARAETLKKAHVGRASDIFLVTGNDELNTEIATKCTDIVEGGKKSAPDNFLEKIVDFLKKILRKITFLLVRGGFIRRIKKNEVHCHVHIVDRNLYDMLLLSNMMTDSYQSPFKMDFFNLYQIAGCCIVKKHHPFLPLKEGEKIPHILVIGAGRMGESLIVRTAKLWKKSRKTGENIQISCIDKDPGDKAKIFEWRYPALNRYCDLKIIEQNIYDLDFLNGSFLKKITHTAPISKVYICIDNTTVGMTSALTLARMPEFSRTDIIVRSTYIGDAMDIFQKFHNRSDDSGTFSNITAFPIVEDDCCLNYICGGLREMIARASHKKYREKRLQKEKDPITDDPSLNEWDSLPDDLRNSNLDQVDHIYQKLRSINFHIETRKNWDEAPFPLKEYKNMVDQLARMEHSRWCRERRDAGWIYGKPHDKEEKYRKRITEYLVPYDDLSEEIKENDRNAVRRIPEFLELVDLKMVQTEESK